MVDEPTAVTWRGHYEALQGFRYHRSGIVGTIPNGLAGEVGEVLRNTALYPQERPKCLKIFSSIIGDLWCFMEILIAPSVKTFGKIDVL